MKGYILSVLLFVLSQITVSQTSYVWNGGTSTAWNTPTNWTPNGTPGAADNVTIVTGGNNCILPSSIAITNLTITTGVLNLGGNTLTVTGVLSATGGQCNNGTLSATGASQTFSGTNFGANISVNPSATNDVYFNGSAFGGSVNVTRNNSTNIQSTGGNTFNGVTSITNAGSGYLLMTNNAAKTEVFNAALTLNTSNTGALYVAYSGNVTLAANVTVNNTSGNGNIQLGRATAGGVTLNNGIAITTGSFAGATLLLQNFTQVGSTALNLSPGANGGVNLYSVTINGNLTVSAGDVYTRNSTYAGTVSFTKLTGTNPNNMNGGNTFASTLTINYTSTSGTGFWGFAGVTADTYNGDVYVNNNSLDRILWGVGGSSLSSFNGNVTLTQIGSSVGISTGWSSSTGWTLANGKTISIGGAGYSVGYLYLQGLTQAGSAALSLTLTGASSLHVGYGNLSGPVTIGGSFTVSAPDVYFRGGTFNGPVTITKTGAGNDNNSGNLNTFNSTCNINNQGSAGYFMLGYNSADVFNDNITVTSTGAGAINLGFSSGTGTPTLAAGKTVLIGGAGFSAGSLSFGGFTQLGNAAMNLSLTGATTITFCNNSSIGGNLITSSDDIYFNGCTFNGTVNSTKTGSNGNYSSGGNTFQQASTFTNLGAGYFLFGNGSPDIWNGDVNFVNNGSERILPCWNSAGNQFNGNIIVSNIGTSTGIEFCGGGASSSCTLAAGKNIQIGAGGFSTGYLHLYRFTQLGNAASNLTLTGATTVINIGPSSAIGGDFTVVSPRILLNGATYSGNVNLTKNGSTGEWSNGGNVFNGTTTINMLGSAFFGFANGSPDIFNGDVYVNNNSSDRVIFGNSSAGNQFNGNVILTQIGSSVGIAFGWNAATAITMAAGKTISIGAAGFSVGYLQIERFTQLGNAAMNLPLNGATSLTFGPTTVIGGNMTSTSATLFFNGSTFNGNVDATKTGSSSDASTGGNIFQGTCNLTNSGSGYLLLGNNTADTWNGDVTFTNTGSERILPCWNSAGNQFNGNIVFNSSGSSVGINFCGAATANATQAAGFSLSIGAGGFSAGYLILQRFTQLGNSAINLTLASSANYLQFGPSSSFGGNVTCSSPGLYFNGATFSGTVDGTKTGSSNDNSSGGNTFNNTTTITNNGSGQVLLGNGSPDAFNGATTFNNNGSYRFYYAHNHAGQATTFGSTLVLNSAKTGGADGWSFFAAESNNTNLIYNSTVTYNITGVLQSNCRNLNGSGGTATYNGDVIINIPNTNASTQIQMGATGVSTYNGNIVVTNSGGSTGIYFNPNAAASSTLANTKTITIGAAGFSSGNLSLVRFTQLGGTSQALTLTGTGILTVGPTSAFGGNVNFLAPQLYLNGCIYSGTATLEKNGATDNYGSGGNTFNGTTIITNSGSGYLLTGGTNADQFNAVTTFNNTGSYRFYFAHNHSGQTTTFATNLTINSAKTGGADPWSFFISEGNNSNVSFGGNVIINCSGAIRSDFRLLQGTGTTATYTGDLTINITNTNVSTQINMGTVGVSTYNGNMVVSNSGGASGIYFNTSASASSTLANTKTITIGAGGFNAGTLSLIRFTQTGGTAQSLTLTGTGNLTFGPSSAFGGNVTCVSPTLLFNGCTFSGTTNCTKNGSTNDQGVGNNIFTGVSTINNSGSGYLMFGNGSRDQWLTDVTFNNTGSNIIYVAYSSTNNSFGGNVICNNVGSTGNNSGIYFCSNTNATANISSGNLTINNNPTSGTNNGIRICEGNTSSFSVGGTTSITNVNNGISNYIRFGNGTGSSCTFTGDVTVNNNGTTASTNVVHFSYTGNSTFNGNITLNSTGGAGVIFGSSGGTSTQANNKTINTSTFTGGPLYLRNFVQSGPTTGNTSNVSITGANQLLTFNGSSFYDNITGSSQQITSTNSTFRGTTSLTKVSGNAADNWAGGNTFNGTTTIKNQSTFTLLMANTTADAYNGDVTFWQTGTGIISPSYNANCTYGGNIIVNVPAAVTITFGSGTGTSTMNGTGTQTISVTSGLTPVFSRFTMNHTGTGVILNTPINVSTNLTMTNGQLFTTSTNILTMLNASTASALTSASTSYVNGPMKYQKSVAGSTILNFPIGKGSDCRPIVLTVNHTGATLYNYTSELFNADPWVAFNSGSPYVATNMPQTVDTISKVHYWNIARTDGAGAAQSSAGLSGNQQIQLYFDLNDQVYQGSSLTIVKNTSATPAVWIDIGGSCALGNFSTPQVGSVTSTSSPTAFTSFSAFTLGSKADFGWNPLPIELLYFNAKPVNNTVDLTWSTSTETNNKFFTIEKSKNGVDFEFLQNINSEAFNGNSKTTLNYRTYDLNPYTGTNYYRLKQTDYNGNYKYAKIAKVDFDKKSFVSVFPNPASNNLFVNVSNDYDNASLKFTDELGREVLSQNINASNINTINTEALSPGIYYVIVDNGNGEVNKTKITIQK